MSPQNVIVVPVKVPVAVPVPRASLSPRRSMSRSRSPFRRSMSPRRSPENRRTMSPWTSPWATMNGGFGLLDLQNLATIKNFSNAEGATLAVEGKGHELKEIDNKG